ncbi:MAG TPA: hypothetical protein DD377_02360 [Firmicutes bacterium]|nr:hypothetical protein [Bacillota bacterium]HBM70222.1 hypothetical protein [Bacillota bacterium]
MLVYIIGLLSSLCLALFCYEKTPSSRIVISRGELEIRDTYRKFNFLCLLPLLPFLLISGFRYGIGTDYFYTYVPEIDSILSGGEGFKEPFVNLLIKFFGLFTSSPTPFFFFTSFIYLIFVFLSINKYSKNPIMSILIFFLSMVFFIQMNNIRQSVAASIILYSFSSLKDNKHLKFFLLIILSGLFHNSGFLFILVYFIYHMKFVKKHFLFFSFILALSIPFLGRLFILIMSSTSYRYFLMSYLTNEETTWGYILYNLVIFIISYLVLRKDIKMNNVSFLLLLIQLISTVIPILSFVIPSSEFVTRLDLPFVTFQMILIPHLIYKSKKGTFKVGISLLCILLFSFITYYYIVKQGYHGVLPYKDIFGWF